MDLIAGDLAYIRREFGHDSLEFHDDDLLQHQQFDDLMELLRSTRLSWTCNARSEFITRDRAEQMVDAGCRKVFLGIESLSQQSLDYYRKATTVEMNQAAVQLLEDSGIGVVCGFIIGAPHDTLESALADIDRMLALPIYFLSASILTPDIGTLEFHRAKRTIRNLPMLGDDGTKLNIKPRPELFGEAPPFGMPTVCKALTKDQLNELYELAVCSFFLRDSALNLIMRHTLQERLPDVNDWYGWVTQRLSRLRASATLAPVHERAEALADASRSLRHPHPWRSRRPDRHSMGAI